MAGTVERLPSYPITEIFPKAKYKNAGHAMALHYLIALNQPEKNIQGWLEQHPEYLNFSNQEHFGLTPLSVCVIVNNKNLARLFLDRSADPKIGDHQGWTAFHHAAIIGDQEMLILLVQKVGESVAETLLNFAGGNYKDLVELITPRPISLQERVCYYHEGEKEAVACTAEKFQSLTGVPFCHSVVVSPQELIKQWKNLKLEANPDPSAKAERVYLEYLNNAPKISFGRDSPESPYGFDVFAEENIKENQVITTYGGIADSDRPYTAHTIYSMNDVHSEKIRNLGAMINDGFPNCGCSLETIKGFRRLLFIAIRDIKKGEKILFNYGLTHPTKIYQSFPHFELNPGELERYVANGSLVEKLTTLSKGHSSFADRERLKYLLETPSSMLYLLSKGALKREELSHFFDFFEKQYNQAAIKDFILSCYKIEETLEPFLKRGQDKLVENMRALLFYWVQSFPISLIMNEAQCIVEVIGRRLHSIDDFSAFKNSINSLLDFMNEIHSYGIGPERSYTEDFFNQIKAKFKKLSSRDSEIGLREVQVYIAKNGPGVKKTTLQKIYSQLKPSC